VRGRYRHSRVILVLFYPLKERVLLFIACFSPLPVVVDA
jgi:hypothetical protein